MTPCPQVSRLPSDNSLEPTRLVTPNGLLACPPGWRRVRRAARDGGRLPHKARREPRGRWLASEVEGSIERRGFAVNKNLIRQSVIAVAVFATVVVNGFSNALPLNNQTPGAISDRFHVYFVPAGYAFSVWGLIYVGLILFAVFRNGEVRKPPRLLTRSTNNSAEPSPPTCRN